MKKLLLITMFLIPFSMNANTFMFNKTLGGTDNDFVYSTQQTEDGGYIIAGQTESYGNGSHQKPDMWIVKIDKTGNEEWDKTFGGRESDIAFSIQQTTDMGYIVAGTTSSFGKGYPSVWIIRLDPGGDTIWTKIYEGTIVSSARSVMQTADGGYIVAGKGKDNILKLDKNGNKEWGRHYSWIFYSVAATSDGGYIVAGDSIYHQLEWDYIPSVSIIKLDKNGNIVWSNPLGDNFLGSASSVQQTPEGGYIIAGDSIGLKTGYDHSHYSMVCKLDCNGKKEWHYSGSEYSVAQFIRQTKNGGYIVTGNIIDDKYGLDYLIIHIDENGNEKWTKTYGSKGGWEYASSIQQTSDGGYFVAGQADSFGAGRYDIWLLKLDENGNGAGPVGISIPEYNHHNGFSLGQNYPDPFSQFTNIPFDLSESGFVTLRVFNIFGKEIETVFSGQLPPGKSKLKWIPKNLSDGIYFYRLQIGENVKTKSCILLK